MTLFYTSVYYLSIYIFSVCLIIYQSRILSIYIFIYLVPAAVPEKSSDDLFVTLNIYLSLCTQTADPNPFRGTHCMYMTVP